MENMFFMLESAGKPSREKRKESQDWNMMQPDTSCTSNCPYEPVIKEFTSNMDFSWPKQGN